MEDIYNILEYDNMIFPMYKKKNMTTWWRSSLPFLMMALQSWFALKETMNLHSGMSRSKENGIDGKYRLLKI